MKRGPKAAQGEVASALARFRRFHGRSAEKKAFVEIPHPKAVVFLGEALAIEYASDKNVPRLGGKRQRGYRHRFSKGVRVYCDAKGTTLFVTGGRFKVTDWLRY